MELRGSRMLLVVQRPIKIEKVAYDQYDSIPN